MLNALKLIGIVILFIFCSYLFRRKGYKDIVGGIEFLSRYQTGALAGIAISLILISHLGNLSGVRYFTPLGGIGVSLFLIISGYGLGESYKVNGLQNFWTRRIRRVVVPYWIIIVFFTFFTVASDKVFSISKFLKYAVLMDIPHGMYWFLYLVMFWYFSFFILNKFVRKQPYKIYGLLAVSLASLFSIRNQLYAEQAFSFLIGSIISYKKEDIERLLRSGVARSVLICSVVISGAFLAIKQIAFVRLFLNHLSLYLTLQIPIIIFGALAIILFVFMLIPVGYLKVSNQVGHYSYEIYLSHVFFISMVSPTRYLTTIFVFILATTTSSLLLKRIGEMEYRKKIVQ